PRLGGFSGANSSGDCARLLTRANGLLEIFQTFGDLCHTLLHRALISLSQREREQNIPPNLSTRTCLVAGFSTFGCIVRTRYAAVIAIAMPGFDELCIDLLLAQEALTIVALIREGGKFQELLAETLARRALVERKEVPSHRLRFGLNQNILTITQTIQSTGVDLRLFTQSVDCR